MFMCKTCGLVLKCRLIENVGVVQLSHFSPLLWTASSGRFLDEHFGMCTSQNVKCDKNAYYTIQKCLLGNPLRSVYNQWQTHI